jgi:hypothetical protein
MTKIALYTSVEKTEPREFIDGIVRACKKLGIAYIADMQYSQVMVLFGYGLAVFNIERFTRNGEPYLDITIVPIGTKATLSSIIIDILKLLKEMNMNYESLGFIVQ